MILTLHIKGIPKAKQSFKYTKTGKRYRPKDVDEEQSSIRSQVIAQLPEGFKPFTGAVEMYATFYFPPLKSWSVNKIATMRSGVVIPKLTKPDRGNLMKLLEDAVEGVLYINDSQVWKSKEEKRYSDTPGITIIIYGEYEGS